MTERLQGSFNPPRARSLCAPNENQMSSKDFEENDLVRLINDYWSKATFGYPIHEDLRAPSSVAEMLRSES